MGSVRHSDLDMGIVVLCLVQFHMKGSVCLRQLTCVCGYIRCLSVSVCGLSCNVTQCIRTRLAVNQYCVWVVHCCLCYV